MYSVEEHFMEYSALNDVLNSEETYPLQQFFLVPCRWTYFVQHRCETNIPDSRTLSLYHWYRFLVFDIAMHLLILFVVRILPFRAVVRAAFRWIVPNCVIRNWRVVGPSSSQLVMEHELFRHLELELFVKRSQLDAALHFLKHVLTLAENRTAAVDGTFRNQLEDAGCTKEMAHLRGDYCHHYPICVRKILPDDTLISMASDAAASASQTIDDAEHVAQLSGAWYSITLTNYHVGCAGQPFKDLARLLVVSMTRLFGARPHWGKLCPLGTDELRNLYPAFERFAQVCGNADPDGTFRNQWTTELLRAPHRGNPGKKLETS